MTHREATSSRQATAVDIGEIGSTCVKHRIYNLADLSPDAQLHITDQPETNVGQQTALPNLLPENAPAAQLKTSRYGRVINQNPKYKT